MRSDSFEIWNSNTMQSNASHMLRFLISSWKFHEIKSKNQFFGIFSEISGHAYPRPMVDALTFCQMKGIIKIHNHGKFHFYSICGCQVIKFSMFSWRCNIHEIGHFGGFLDPNSPKHGSAFLKFAPAILFRERKPVF